MNDAVEVIGGKGLFERCAIANVDFCEFVAWVFEVVADVLALDFRFVKVVEIVDYGHVFDVGGE
jgi:hypothetical protein